LTISRLIVYFRNSFFFQADDGIRDFHVTGVQTCALPIWTGVWAFCVLTFMLTALSRLDAERMWQLAEERGLVILSRDSGLPAERMAACHACGYVPPWDPEVGPCACERCGMTVRKRHEDMSSRVWALLIAAAVVYIPANVLPMMEIRTLLGNSAHTILGGVIELW